MTKEPNAEVTPEIARQVKQRHHLNFILPTPQGERNITKAPRKYLKNLLQDVNRLTAAHLPQTQDLFAFNHSVTHANIPSSNQDHIRRFLHKYLCRLLETKERKSNRYAINEYGEGLCPYCQPHTKFDHSHLLKCILMEEIRDKYIKESGIIINNFRSYVQHDQVFDRFFQQKEWETPQEQIYWWSDPVYKHLTIVLATAMKLAKADLLNRGGLHKEEGLKIKPQNARNLLQTIQRQRWAFAHRCWVEYQRRKTDIEKPVIPTHVQIYATIFYYLPSKEGFTETMTGCVSDIDTSKRGTFVKVAEEAETNGGCIPARYTFASHAEAEISKHPPQPNIESDFNNQSTGTESQLPTIASAEENGSDQPPPVKRPKITPKTTPKCRPPEPSNQYSTSPTTPHPFTQVGQPMYNENINLNDLTTDPHLNLRLSGLRQWAFAVLQQEMSEEYRQELLDILTATKSLDPQKVVTAIGQERRKMSAIWQCIRRDNTNAPPQETLRWLHTEIIGRTHRRHVIHKNLIELHQSLEFYPPARIMKTSPKCFREEMRGPLHLSPAFNTDFGTYALQTTQTIRIHIAFACAVGECVAVKFDPFRKFTEQSLPEELWGIVPPNILHRSDDGQTKNVAHWGHFVRFPLDLPYLNWFSPPRDEPQLPTPPNIIPIESHLLVPSNVPQLQAGKRP